MTEKEQLEQHITIRGRGLVITEKELEAARYRLGRLEAQKSRQLEAIEELAEQYEKLS